MVFARCCKQQTIPFFTVYGWWEMKLRYCPVKVGLRYTDVLALCVTNTSRKGNLLSYSFSIVNCIDGRIEFTWSSNIWTSSWWVQRMNVSSTYLSHKNGFSYVDPNTISSKYSMYMLANIGDNGDTWRNSYRHWFPKLLRRQSSGGCRFNPDCRRVTIQEYLTLVPSYD